MITVLFQAIQFSISMQIISLRTRHAGHCWRSKDEVVSDVLLWTPAYGQAKAGRPARTYIQQLCDDTRCNPEDLPEAINYRETWREKVRVIRAGRTTWWWWWWDATTLGQSGSGSDGNECLLRIPQSSSITGTSPSHCLVLYPGH